MTHSGMLKALQAAEHRATASGFKETAVALRRLQDQVLACGQELGIVFDQHHEPTISESK